MTDMDNLRRVDPGYKKERVKLKFSGAELVHILAAILVLAAAFTVMLSRSSHLHDNPTANIIMLFGVSLILVTCSFLLHELGHKYMAQKYGAWSEFRAYPFGLLFALLCSFMGFLFAAPGAVYISGNINNEENGKISMAGPAVNFVIAAIAIAICFVTSGVTQDIVYLLAYLNAFLGLFNLIPIPPFDGSKIVRWSIPYYLIAALIGAAELVAVFVYL